MSKTMVKQTSVMVTWKGHLEQYEIYQYMYQFIKIQTWTPLRSRVKPNTDLDFNFSVHIICFIVISPKFLLFWIFFSTALASS